MLQDHPIEYQMIVRFFNGVYQYFKLYEVIAEWENAGHSNEDSVKRAIGTLDDYNLRLAMLDAYEYTRTVQNES